MGERVLQTYGSLTQERNHQILKDAPSVYAAMNAFTAVITVINYPKGHWVTLRFDPKMKVLEVFDSLAPPNFVNGQKIVLEEVCKKKKAGLKLYLKCS